MRSSSIVLPKVLRAPKLSARVWLALGAAIGASVCGYAGLYPRFDEGNLRIILALTSAPFGAAVVAASSSAKTPARAFGRALVFSAILGIASTILPAAMLARWDSHGDNFFAACIFGAFFGAPTGVLYGLPLGILSALGQRHVQASTHESTDRAAQIAGTWLMIIALVALIGTRGLDEGKMDWATQTLAKPPLLPSILACLAGVTGIAFIARAYASILRRSGWIGRVREGLEPSFRVRPVDVLDYVEALPRIGHPHPATESEVAKENATVLEWLPDETSEEMAGTAYRVAAKGRAVAIVSDAATIAF